MPRRFILATLAVLATLTTAFGADAPAFDAKLFQALEYRLVGPFRGGRVTAVAGVVDSRETFYMGSTGGGVWKTADGGTTWDNVSDKGLQVGSIGAIAVAESDANVVYVGTGSACVRGNVSPGNGVYRSTDAGASWKNVGLERAGQIGRIRVHPQHPERVYVAVLGNAFGPSAERGVYRSSDGGASWTNALHVSDRAGAVDLALDPTNPRILYAAFWQVERKPWNLTSGGEDSGLWKSSDGGDSWEKLTEGLPAGPLGRIGVSVSGARPGRVYALVEAEDGGLYRSDDHGKTFRRVNADRNLRQRPWYYTHVHADPVDAETVYVQNVSFWRSPDAGASFQLLRTPHGDSHDLWIHPRDNRVLIEGNDGGANVTYNAGKTWSTQGNQPTAEFYRVAVGGGFPYRLYGGQQDNTTVSIASRTASAGITREDWHAVAGCESGHVAVDPRDPDVTYGGCYGGSIERHDRRTGQTRQIMIYPQLAVGQAASDLRYRFQWNAPIRLSPVDPGVLYHCSQFVHRSTDEGQTWEIISPDLTRNDPSKHAAAGGPITFDNTGAEVYGTVFAFEPSAHLPGVLWAGSDDGLVWLSRDAGQTWENVTPKQMPEWGTVNAIEPSAHDAARAFVAVTRYRLDDFRPWIFRTNDYGKSWKSLADGGNGIPAGHFVRVVREDPDRKGLLYAGTEFGIYVSFDDGARWQPLQLELPATPITDLAVHDQDLVVATQGRSFWILDDLTPLHQMSEAVAEADVFLFAPRATYRFGGGLSFGGGGARGANPPAGAAVHYVLGQELGEADPELTLEILDEGGAVLRSFSSKTPERRAWSPLAEFIPELAEPKKLEVKAGMNRFVWDLRLPDAEIQEGAILWGVAQGPRVPPGRYGVRLRLGDWSATRGFDVVADPRLTATPADFAAQFDLARQTWAALSETHHALGRLRDVRSQAAAVVQRLEAASVGDLGELREAQGRLAERLEAIEAGLHQKKAEAGQDILNFPPRLDNQWLALLETIDGAADARPTQGAIERYADLRAELDGYVAQLQEVVGRELARFNAVAEALAPDAVIVGR